MRILQMGSKGWSCANCNLPLPLPSNPYIPQNITGSRFAKVFNSLITQTLREQSRFRADNTSLKSNTHVKRTMVSTKLAIAWFSSGVHAASYIGARKDKWGQKKINKSTHFSSINTQSTANKCAVFSSVLHKGARNAQLSETVTGLSGSRMLPSCGFCLWLLLL